MHKMKDGEMECASCSLERGILQLCFNGDWLCKECYDEVTAKWKVK